MSEEVKILDYLPEHREMFRQLNYEWIEKDFVIEPSDEKALNNPEEYIIKPGGLILMAEFGDRIVGTCALIKISDGIYELAKMAVTDVAKGKKIGYLLGNAILEKAKLLGTERVELVSNRKLTPAITLYHKLGFREVPMPFSEYARADIKMIIEFK
jgi:putative acetyltransferase